MNRRQILQYTAWITGSAVSAPLAGAILSGCSRSDNDKVATRTSSDSELPILHFFSPDQFKRVKYLADTILPKTDSPSASDVDVHITMDSMLGQVFAEPHQRTFKHNWLALERHLEQQNFMQQDTSQQTDMLSALELSTDSATAEARQGLLDFKQQVIAYYLSTEEIGRNYLNYLPIPGTYEPCISVDDVNNRAWAI
ncbi:gluconate 2-dehydrogenase subunit 3 family protein [Marinimicrobium sp. ABcell2]|uniref:gluconate 2-dehydrogenase subunit 3 family protein n=1 Tax=Marinimicrobium sp. ABcell2 TaxID=3069751 RepID=UPI0027B22806|nr:gluconate 2-dehydrogenase subunit 3 family protein [Marinimicrobium sp. ABcell2]MDQ2076780.1 gluconate 2-dehydrogenase subunit 3 family protein [Marinimicrobium sp. ABcell2]